MTSKLVILVIALNLSAIYALPAIGNGLIGARGVIGAAPIGAVYGGLGLGAGLGLAGAGVGRVAGPVAVGGLGLAQVSAIGLGHYGQGLAGLALPTIGVGITPYQGPVPAAIETIRTHQVIDVPTSQEVIAPSTLIIEPNVMPVNIEFRSQSSPVNVNQVHIPGRPGIVERTSSEEEPDRLIHEVVKPVVQEVRETIVPFRRITQEILPVQEEVHSLVARGQRQQVLAAPVAAPVAVAAPVGVVGGGLVSGGLVGSGLVSGGLVGGGLVGGGLVNGGLITTGINRIGAGLVNGGLVHGGVLAKEIIRARS